MTISARIFAIAAVMIVVMVVVAAHGLFRVADVREDLAEIEAIRLPTLYAVEDINDSVLEQWVFLDQVLRSDRVVLDSGRFDSLDASVVAALSELRANAPEAFQPDVQAFDAMYEEFASYAADMLLAHAVADYDTVRFLLPGLEEAQTAVDTAAENLRKTMEGLVEADVAAAEDAEAAMLITDAILTGIAAALGLGIAFMAAQAIVAGVRRLVKGAESVAEGDLDSPIDIQSEDEVGRLAKAFNTMLGELRVKQRIRETFGKYMDPRIVEDLIEHPEVAERGGQRREMSIMFIDLVNYTNIAERLPPDDLVEALDAYFQYMTDLVAEHGGVVDKFIGDAVMAYWGEPFVPAGKNAENACRAAAAAAAGLDRLRGAVSIALDGLPAGIEIGFRVGVATGDVLVGTVGSTASRSFTVIGDAVNLASRLEGASKAYGTTVIIDDRTRMLAGPAFRARELDRIRVKGKDRPTSIHELIGLAPAENAQPDDAGGDEQEWIRRFESGLAAYRARRWDAAELAFRDCQVARPDDGPSAVFLERVEHFRNDPPPEDWDGVWTFETK